MQAEDYDRVLDKIRKLMAMAERGNSPYEQAIALRQAEALMRKHGTDRAEIFGTATPFGEQPAWEDTFTSRAEADSRSEFVAETSGLRFATLAQWAVRLSWLLILFVPVSAQVVSEPAPAIANVLQMPIDAWSESGLLAAAVALLVGVVKLVLVALWTAFWRVSLVMHALFWDLLGHRCCRHSRGARADDAQSWLQRRPHERGGRLKKGVRTCLRTLGNFAVPAAE